jgi:signal transduction histidine kinase
MLAGIFFNLRGVVVTSASTLILGFAFNAIEPESGLMFWTHRSLLYFLTLGSVLLVTFILHLNNLEKVRRAELTGTNKLLQTSLEQIREINETLETRIDERTRDLKIAKEEADAARGRAEKANEIKSQFLASMSHELRTPLNSILTFTQLLGMGSFGPVNDEQKEYLDKSLGSGRHLLALINDVLDVTKIQSGMMKLFIENDFDPVSELREIVSVAEKLLADKPVKLIADIDPSLPTLTCDKRRVRQVLLNLISNAVKFTEQGSITLSAKARPDSILLAVSDTGPGIAPEDHNTIFNPFVQAETGIRHGGGTGLGLPISKSLVEAHGGRLWLESVPGEGAAFYVSLPLQPGLGLGEQEI